MSIPILGKLNGSAAVNDRAPNRVVIEFPDDHSIDGAKFDVTDVTPLQIFAAVFYLTRIANQLEDARMLAAARGASEIAAVRDLIDAEGRSNGG